MNGGADGTPGAAGAGIRDIYFSGETEEGRLYYAMVGMKAYPILVPKGDAGRDAALFVQDDEPTEAKVGDLWFDTDEEVETPSGGASSWNDLTDKPFGEVYSDTLTWDGDSTGLVSVVMLDMPEYGVRQNLVKVSDAVPTAEDFSNGVSCVMSDGSVYTEITSADDDIIVAEGCIVVLHDNCTLPNGVFVEKAGTYFVEGLVDGDPPSYAASITINGYTGFGSVKTIDTKYIPDTIQRTITGTPGDFVVIGEDGKVTTGEPPAGGGETWRLIADIELTEEVNGVEITQDMDGNEIHLKKFYVLLTSIAPTANGFTTIKTVVNRSLGASMGGFDRGHTIANNVMNNSSTATRYYYCLVDFVRDAYCGCWHGASTNLYNQTTEMQQMLRGYSKLYEDNDIFRILITPNDGGTIIGGVGSTVKIWGVDA